MRLRSIIPAVVVLVLTLCTTTLAALMVRKDVESLERRQFLLEASAAKDAIVNAMGTYELALRAGAGLFRSSGDVTETQWRHFVESLDLERTYPGFQGFGFAAAVADTDRASFEARQQEQGRTEFQIRPPGERETYTAIVLLEPLNVRNRRAFGFDMFAEATRRAAMESARDTGETALSGKVTLVQEAQHEVQPGTLMYLPVYNDGPAPASVDERRKRLRGYTFGAFRMDDLIHAVLRKYAPDALADFDLAVYDGHAANSTSLLFRAAKPSPGPTRFSVDYPLSIAGRAWSIKVAADAPVQKVADTSKPFLVFAAGTIISLLIAAITAFQALARHDLSLSRQTLAKEVAERKKAQESAEMANSELIHRVKNTLAIVSAIASQTVRYSATLDDFSKAFRERLASLARVQDLLRPDGQREPDLEVLIRQLLDPYTKDSLDRLTVMGPAITVPRNDVVLFSLAFNELATNATKYGAWSQGTGSVHISWRVERQEDTEQVLLLNWEEVGGPAVGAPAKKGFGSAVMQFAIARAMGGKIDVSYHANGLRYVMHIPRRANVAMAVSDGLGNHPTH